MIKLWFAGKTLTFRFGDFATVTNGVRVQRYSNEAGRVLAAELESSGWKRVD